MPTPWSRQRGALLLAVDEVIVILHRDELRPPVLIGDVLRLRDSFGPAVADYAKRSRAVP
jgi:hypothetical protein